MRRTVFLITSAALVLFTACGADGDTGAAQTSSSVPVVEATPPSPAATATPSATADASTPTPVAQVPEELAFTASIVGGGTFDGASLAGRPAVLWFWAPWCPVCQREASLIADLAARYEGRAVFVGVAGLSGDVSAMEEFIADGGVEGIPHIDDRGGDVYSRFGVTQQYDFGFVSADGSVEVIRGPLEEHEIEAAVEKLVNGGS